MLADDPRHGTNAGYIAHTVTKVPPCEPCRAASAAYQRERDKRLYFSRSGTLRVPSLGYLRRIQALVALGYAMQDLDREFGYRAGSVSRFLRERPPWVLEARARKIEAVYRRLSMRPAPAGFARTRALAVAQRSGWVVPLAWDDIDNDEHPRIERHKPKPGRPETVAQILEDFDWLTSAGESPEKAAERVGVTLSTIRDYRARAARREMERAS